MSTGQPSTAGLSISVTGALKVIRTLWGIPVVRWAVTRGLEYATRKVIERIRKKRLEKLIVLQNEEPS